MLRVEVTPLDFAVEARLFAVLLGFVVLLTLLKEPMCRVVMRQILVGLKPILVRDPPEVSLAQGPTFRA